MSKEFPEIPRGLLQFLYDLAVNRELRTDFYEGDTEAVVTAYNKHAKPQIPPEDVGLLLQDAKTIKDRMQEIKRAKQDLRRNIPHLELRKKYNAIMFLEGDTQGMGGEGDGGKGR